MIFDLHVSIDTISLFIHEERETGPLDEMYVAEVLTEHLRNYDEGLESIQVVAPLETGANRFMIRFLDKKGNVTRAYPKRCVTEKQLMEHWGSAIYEAVRGIGLGRVKKRVSCG